jgi:hypothetical protein
MNYSINKKYQRRDLSSLLPVKNRWSTKIGRKKGERFSS